MINPLLFFFIAREGVAIKPTRIDLGVGSSSSLSSTVSIFRAFLFPWRGIKIWFIAWVRCFRRLAQGARYEKSMDTLPLLLRLCVAGRC